jgi:cytochrome c553
MRLFNPDGSTNKMLLPFPIGPSYNTGKDDRQTLPPIAGRQKSSPHQISSKRSRKMKKTVSFLALACTFVLAAVPVAAQEASVAMGQQLFNNPGLGASKNDKSCNSCHPGGKGLEKAGAKADLADMINKCIKGPLQGEGIGTDTVAMQSLEMYIKSLAAK